MIYNKTIYNFGRVINEAVDIAIQRMKEGEINDEPVLTGVFTEILRSKINENPRLGDYTFKANIYRGIGRNAPENKIGADLCGIINIYSSEEKISKGFLMQAKWAERNGITISQVYHHTPTFSINNDFNNLCAQCVKMLNITPDSYVILYSINGFTIVPASSIIAITKQKGRVKIYSKNVPSFFKEFCMSFIGDIKLNAQNYDDPKIVSIINFSDYILEIDVKKMKLMLKK